MEEQEWKVTAFFDEQGMYTIVQVPKEDPQVEGGGDTGKVDA